MVVLMKQREKVNVIHSPTAPEEAETEAEYRSSWTAARARIVGYLFVPRLITAASSEQRAVLSRVRGRRNDKVRQSYFDLSFDTAIKVTPVTGDRCVTFILRFIRAARRCLYRDKAPHFCECEVLTRDRIRKSLR